LQVSVAVTAACAAVDGASSPTAAAGMQVLTRLAPESWSADRLADLCLALYDAGLDAGGALLDGALHGLGDRQRDDGGWTSEYGPDRDVDLALRALGALLASGRTSG
jgi:hypothetical protein